MRRANPGARFLSRAASLFLFLLLLGLCWGLGRYYYVGLIHDDAQYLLGAFSLQSGTYSKLYAPGEPAFTAYPPGYPLFLTPFARLSDEPWLLLRGLTLLLLLISCWMLRRWERDRPIPWATLLFAFHPITLSYATTLMSDVLFTCLTIAGFTFLKTALESPRKRTLLKLSLVTGYAALTRSVGILLIPAMAVGFFVLRRWKIGCGVGGFSLLIASLFSLRNYFKGEIPIGESYQSIWMESLIQVLSIGSFALKLLTTLYSFLVIDFLSLPQSLGWSVFWRVCLSLIVLGTLLYGMRTYANRSEVNRAWTIAALIFLASMGLVHGLWAWVDSRFALPLIPLIAFFFVEGCRRGLSHVEKSWHRWSAGGIVCLCFIAAYGSTYAALQQQAAARWVSPRERLPAKTYRWIMDSLPPSAIILYAKPAELYLYSHQKGLGMITADDAMQFRLAVLKGGMTHVLTRPMTLSYFVGRSPDLQWKSNQFWASTWPSAFKRIYHNPAEATGLYEVQPSSTFEQAYVYYDQARKALSQRDTQKAFDLYSQALQLDSSLLPVMIRYGELALAENQRQGSAIRYLSAVPAFENHPVVLFLRARLHDQLGASEKALHDRRRAEELIRSKPEWDFLRATN
jgi:hypothetical protein